VEEQVAAERELALAEPEPVAAPPQEEERSSE
jgi:hypothetical protein